MSLYVMSFGKNTENETFIFNNLIFHNSNEERDTWDY